MASSSSSSRQASSVPADNSTSTLAYQVQDFIDSKHPWSQEITASRKQAIAQYLRTTVRPDQSNTSGRHTRSKSKAATMWPREWATDLSKLKQDVDRTVLAIQVSPTETSSKPPRTSSSSPGGMADNERAGRTGQGTREDQGFTNAQRQELSNLIAQAVTAAMVVQVAAGNNGNGTTGAAPTNPTPTPTPTTPAPSTHWRADEIGLFDPHLDKSHGDGEIVTVGKDVYYRSVMLFIERIRDMATIKGAQLVRINLNTCLRGASLAWYTSELSNLERVGLQNDENGVEEWC